MQLWEHGSYRMSPAWLKLLFIRNKSTRGQKHGWELQHPETSAVSEGMRGSSIPF